ncbi:MAG: NifB/NifX family molybdenum-iron cluster-binding protein [Thiomargarita sp.]|nr:NifB/NifX family molybdenum-iron cluster-binding protein [Thiomargarita sp.]
MKICFPVGSNEGLESEVYDHFGSAPLFIVFDTEEKSIDAINNQDLGHAHGMCTPLKALDGKEVDAIVVGGIGAGAISKLNNMGIKVYRAIKGSVQANIELFENNAMSEISMEHACSGHGHGHGGGCAH